jgi:hypothetical protein
MALKGKINNAALFFLEGDVTLASTLGMHIAFIYLLIQEYLVQAARTVKDYIRDILKRDNNIQNSSNISIQFYFQNAIYTS